MTRSSHILRLVPVVIPSCDQDGDRHRVVAWTAGGQVVQIKTDCDLVAARALVAIGGDTTKCLHIYNCLRSRLGGGHPEYGDGATLINALGNAAQSVRSIRKVQAPEPVKDRPNYATGTSEPHGSAVGRLESVRAAVLGSLAKTHIPGGSVLGASSIAVGSTQVIHRPAKTWEVVSGLRPETGVRDVSPKEGGHFWQKVCRWCGADADGARCTARGHAVAVRQRLDAVVFLLNNLSLHDLITSQGGLKAVLERTEGAIGASNG